MKFDSKIQLALFISNRFPTCHLIIIIFVKKFYISIQKIKDTIKDLQKLM